MNFIQRFFYNRRMNKHTEIEWSKKIGDELMEKIYLNSEEDVQ